MYYIRKVGVIHQANNTEILSFRAVTLFFVQHRVFPNTRAKPTKPYSIKTIVSPVFFNQLTKKTMRYKRVKVISLTLLDHLCKSFERFSDAKHYFRLTYDTYITLNSNYVNLPIHRVICRSIIIIIVIVYSLVQNSSLQMSSFATRIIHTSKTLW